MQQQAQSELLQNEIPYWEGLERENCKLLKTDYEYSEESSKQKYVKSVDIELSKEETEELLKNTNRAYNTEINDILLTALGLTVQEWTSEEQVLINLEGHGREKLKEISTFLGQLAGLQPIIQCY